MPISLDRLAAAARRERFAKARTLMEARGKGMQTAFLCHSHKDAALLNGLAILFDDAGWNIYVDWTDTEMPETPNRETANRIKQRIVEMHYFLFLATANSMSSRWCPWEIGYADGKKPLDDILIIPTTDTSGRWHGNEYLQLYRRIDDVAGALTAIAPGASSGHAIRSL